MPSQNSCIYYNYTWSCMIMLDHIQSFMIMSGQNSCMIMYGVSTHDHI